MRNAIFVPGILQPLADEGDFMRAGISVSKQAIADFCNKNGINRLSIFGSALRDDFRPSSDINILVEFEPDRIPGLLGIERMERELSDLFNWHRIDLRTPEDLSRYFRHRVLEEAEVQYAAG